MIYLIVYILYGFIGMTWTLIDYYKTLSPDDRNFISGLLRSGGFWLVVVGMVMALIWPITSVYSVIRAAYNSNK